MNGWRKELNYLISSIGIGLTTAAIMRELDKPPQDRTWHGKVAGLVPYDFRIPTPRRLRDTYWNPNSDRILTGQAFGVGWTVNLYALLHRLRALAEREPTGPA